MDKKGLQLFVDLVAHEGHKHHVPGCQFKVTGADLTVKKGRLQTATCQVVFEVPAEACNQAGMLFGGIVSSITDIITSCLIHAGELKAKKRWNLSFSTFLGVEYVRGAAIGDTVVMQVGVDKISKTLCFSYADFYRLDDDEQPDVKTGLFAVAPSDILYRTRHQKHLSKMMITKTSFATEKSQQLMEQLSEVYGVALHSKL
mmetsp:Transcript_10070/g.16273  ORF Transcript_10070/g.16273 Transcript_10070/m.16273 type:complete len:201 (-) Transcript_10070:203-805(-)